MAASSNLKIPLRFADAGLAHLTEAFECVVDYADAWEPRKWSTDKGLTLCGPPGIGKTYALAALTKAYAGERDYVFVTAPTFFELYAYATDRAQMDRFRGCTFNRTFERVPWLVLNDLGKEYRSGKLEDQVVYKLGRLLRYRSERLLKTFISTNLTPLDGEVTLESMYGESIVSLIAEMTHVYEIGGEDRRKYEQR